MFRSISQKTQGKNQRKKTRRLLRFEMLEFRELLSASALGEGTDWGSPEFIASDSVYFDAPSNINQNVSGQNDSVQEFHSLAASSAVLLAPPKSARPPSSATPTTLTVSWNPPVATSTLKTDAITDFKVVLQDAKTKTMIDTQIVSVSTHSILFEGLNVKTRYEILVTSIGDSSTSSEKATLKITATTADFKATSAKASNVTMTSVKLTITDNDKNIPFVAGKTVKTYTVQYVERTASKPDWSLAQSQTLTPGTPILDTKKGTVAVQLSGLIPGTQYFFRVQTSYTDGTSVLKTINVDGRQVTFKTAAFPTISISKTSFAVDKSSGYDLAVGLTGKVANINKIETGMTISFSLWVSTATTIDKATGKLTGAQALSIPVTFSSINSKGEFSMLPIELESIVNTLGAGKMLASKTLSFQLEAAFSGVTTTSCSKTGKITMPAWYSV